MMMRNSVIINAVRHFNVVLIILHTCLFHNLIFTTKGICQTLFMDNKRQQKHELYNRACFLREPFRCHRKEGQKKASCLFLVKTGRMLFKQYQQLFIFQYQDIHSLFLHDLHTPPGNVISVNTVSFRLIFEGNRLAKLFLFPVIPL